MKQGIHTSDMEYIRPISIGLSDQNKAVHTILEMIQGALEKLLRMEAGELEEHNRCMICQNEYGSGNPDADTVEEAMRLPCKVRTFLGMDFYLLGPDRETCCGSELTLLLALLQNVFS